MGLASKPEQTNSGTIVSRSPTLSAAKVLIAMSLILNIGQARAEEAEGLWECGELYVQGQFGPWDYTNPAHLGAYKELVEGAHFTWEIESLTSERDTYLLNNLDYTLRAFPNHHRALNAMANFQLEKPVRPGSQHYTAECYFRRGMRFKPDDGTVRLLYGVYLHRLGELKRARKRYKEALSLEPDNAGVHYNLGLLYIDVGEMEEAKKHAARAYDLGYPLPGLKNRLDETSGVAENGDS